MIEGGLIAFLLLFSSPEKVISKHLEGTWEVRVDRSDLTRPEWRRVQTFEACGADEIIQKECKGHFGWIDQPGIYNNLLDKTYFNYGLVKKSGKGASSTWQLMLNDAGFDFLLDISRDELLIYQSGREEIWMELKKVQKKTLKRAAKSNPPNALIVEDTL